MLQKTWIEHPTVLEEMFTRLQKARLKVNARKSCFGAHKFDYLDYHVTCDRVMPIPNKVGVIQSLTVPKLAKNCVILLVWSTSTVKCGKTALGFLPH